MTSRTNLQNQQYNMNTQKHSNSLRTYYSQMQKKQLKHRMKTLLLLLQIC